jgi:hypothetical protein
MRGSAGPRGRRRALTVAVAAAGAVGVTLGAVVALQPGRSGDTPDGATLAAGSRTAVPVVELDLGPVDPSAVEDCLPPGFAADPSSVTVRYGVEQRSPDGSAPVLVVESAEGDLALCDAAGPDRPAQLPLPEPDADHPVRRLSNDRLSWECDDGRTLAHTSSSWLAVRDEVATVRQRFVVDGEPRAWFATSAVDGLAHLQTWLDRPLARSARLEVEWRVLDADGEVVPQSVLPTRRTRTGGCDAAPGEVQGDVQVG